MATHNALGTAGEQAAAEYLEHEGYEICHRNWRKNHLELDIVARKDGLLVVAEVKTRTDNLYMEPQEAVDGRKIRRIVTAADAYIKHFQIDAPVRFDIISVTGKPGAFRVEHIPGAFYPPLF